MYKIFTLFSAGVLLFSSCQTMEEKASEIHHNVFTIDSHTDTPLKFFNTDFNIGIEHDGRKGEGKIDIPRMEKGGLDAVFFAVFIGQGERDSVGYASAFAKAEQIFKASQTAVELNSEKAEIATTAEHGYILERKGKRAIYFGIENGYPIGDNLDNINHFYDLGARYITLVHTKNNDISDSSTDQNGAEFNGLSAFGEKVVERMNQLGIMIDVSHASDSAFYDVLKLSKHPIIASHSCARALCNHPRNLNDDMLKALAKNGCVVQMCILSDYVKEHQQSAERDSAIKAFWAKHSEWSNYAEEE
ncbi:MAG: membrane dipeptidase, partial [Salinivirgaceae bacterium]|nr:membrane dipeptidase [Salinivirgaceae bacterium]